MTGIADGIVNADGAIFFLVNARGLAIAGSAKGFAYCEDPDRDARVVTSDLDSEEVQPKGELLMRHVDGNWWLALDTR
jgi:septum formation inhibitor MinC